jgi:hypothetical protein
MLRQVGQFLIFLTRFQPFPSPRQSIKWVPSLRLGFAFTVHPEHRSGFARHISLNLWVNSNISLFRRRSCTQAERVSICLKVGQRTNTRSTAPEIAVTRTN